MVVHERTKPFTPREASALLDVAESTIRAQLTRSPLDGRNRVSEGPWQGTFKRGTHWRIPPAVVKRVAGQPTRDTARAAARAAAWAAAWAAAGDAAGDAAAAALAPTTDRLQESAVALVTALCAVGRKG